MKSLVLVLLLSVMFYFVPVVHADTAPSSDPTPTPDTLTITVPVVVDPLETPTDAPLPTSAPVDTPTIVPDTPVPTIAPTEAISPIPTIEPTTDISPTPTITVAPTTAPTPTPTIVPVAQIEPTLPPKAPTVASTVGQLLQPDVDFPSSFLQFEKDGNYYPSSQLTASESRWILIAAITLVFGGIGLWLWDYGFVISTRKAVDTIPSLGYTIPNEVLRS